MYIYSSSFNLFKNFWTVVEKWMWDKEDQEEGYENL